jgi:preprotein translocase subunit SecG
MLYSSSARNKNYLKKKTDEKKMQISTQFLSYIFFINSFVLCVGLFSIQLLPSSHKR